MDVCKNCGKVTIDRYHFCSETCYEDYNEFMDSMQLHRNEDDNDSPIEVILDTLDNQNTEEIPF